jgi:hypothetical protein
MPEQHIQTDEVDEDEEVLDVIFPWSDQKTEVVHPCKVPIDFNPLQ